MAAKINNGPMLGQRHLQTFLLFLAIVVNFMAKFNVSVALVAMTNTGSQNSKFDTFDWSEMERSYILSSFFWGYVLTQFLGGWLGRQIGCKITMFISTFGSALLVVLPPFCVSWGGWQSYCAIRVGMGVFQGFLFPCVHTYLADWAPVEERNRLAALAHLGIDCGLVMAMFVSGIVAASSLGWPGISYISCGIGLFWCMLWAIFAANTPRESKYITDAELNYIESSKMTNMKPRNLQGFEKSSVPWRAIFTSVPFWALLITRCSQLWGFSTLQAEIPAYMNGVLLMDMKRNAFYSALPYFASFFMAISFLVVADILLTRQVLSLRTVRKTFNSIAFWIPAMGLIAVGFVSAEHKTLAIVLMTVNVAFNSGSVIGSGINGIDLSPNYAGILMGIINTAVNVVSLLTPLFAGLVVKDEHSRSQWQVVFIVAAVILFVGSLVFLIWGRVELQPWNDGATPNRKQIENGVFRKKSLNSIEKE